MNSYFSRFPKRVYRWGSNRSPGETMLGCVFRTAMDSVFRWFLYVWQTYEQWQRVTEAVRGNDCLSRDTVKLCFSSLNVLYLGINFHHILQIFFGKYSCSFMLQCADISTQFSNFQYFVWWSPVCLWVSSFCNWAKFWNLSRELSRECDIEWIEVWDIKVLNIKRAGYSNNFEAF